MDKSLFKRPNKPKSMVVTRRRKETPAMALPDIPKIPAVDQYTECHVTPLAIAHRMVSYLGGMGDYLTLEPSAGTGNLLQALYDSGHSPYELVAIERHINLCSEIRKRFSGNQTINPICECFLAYAEKAQGQIEYPRIIMNPPFKKVRQHIKAALSLLGKAGHSEAVLVALVPITYSHEDVETLEELPRDTFSLAAVSTKIVRFTQ